MIEEGIRNESSKRSIAETIGKDPSTVAKEIRLHRKLTHRCFLPRECAAYRKCRFGRACTMNCPDFVPFVCKRRDRTPGACNGCDKQNRCRFNKYIYSPEQADTDYHKTLVDSRTGVSLTVEEAEEIAAVVRPLILKGQSPYDIIESHPELGISEKTLYNYIEGGIFSSLPEEYRIAAVDLRRTVSRRITKKDSVKYKKRIPRKFLVGRTYDDYLAFHAENPDVFVTEMDTVYNSEKGPFVQTFKLIKTGLLFGFYHETKTSDDMVKGVEELYRILGREIFQKYCSVLLTDRGTEFSDPEHMERTSDGLLRTRVFFCDPMASGQKGSLENKHRELRYILPKGYDLRVLGLTDQEQLNRAFSNIDSAPVESLGGHSPLAATKFLFPDLYEKLEKSGLEEIDPDKVVLQPYLLRSTEEQ